MSGIDFQLPDFSSPMMRDLYNALRGLREPTTDEKAVAVAVIHDKVFPEVQTKMAEEELSPDARRNVWLLIERATQIDPEGTQERVKHWLAYLLEKKYDQTD